jgi:Amt family ammonium transporter
MVSQLRTVQASARARPDVDASIVAIAVEIEALSDGLAAALAIEQSPRAILAEFDSSLAELERTVKRTYDREEISYFASTSDSLAAQATSQLVMVVVAVAIAALGVILGILLRRRLRNQFAKAYFRLEAEMAERVRAETALRHQAFHDALTGAPNRTLFLDRLGELVAGNADRLAVLFVDLDDFKTINDSLGHAAGDVLLIKVAERISGCLRQDDMAARLGGDEFAALLVNPRSRRSAEDVAARILASLRRPFDLGGETVVISGTVGIAEFGPGSQLSAEDLLRNADLAMYAAKTSGKNRSSTFQLEMHHDAIRRLTARTELERALTQRELVLHYQPIVDLADGSIVAVEALVRWQHPERGLISPGEFVPIAEESGLIVPIGRWVLQEATRCVSGWIRDGVVDRDFGVSVNVSARQLPDGRLVADVRAALAASGLPAACLTVEVTETLLVTDLAAAATSLEQLKAMGVQLAIDDFGTGYASLSYLSKFPIDLLKVDRSFIADASGTGPTAVLARTIIGLGSAIGMPTLAEGIEEPGQIALVRELGCRFGQGYLFARPASATDVVALLRGSADDAAVLRRRRGLRAISPGAQSLAGTTTLWNAS